MKKKDHILLFLLLLLLSFKSEGQLEIGLKLGNGISKVKYSFFYQDPTYTYSGQFGFYSVLPINEKNFIQCEILFNQIEGRATALIPYRDDDGQEIGFGTALYNTHLSYLSIPFKLGSRKKKSSLLIGLQISFELFNQRRNRLLDENMLLSTPYDSKMKINTPKYDIGPIAEFNYDILENLSIGFQGYIGLKDLITEEDELPLGKHQLLLNVYYKFYEHNNVGE